MHAAVTTSEPLFLQDASFLIRQILFDVPVGITATSTGVFAGSVPSNVLKSRRQPTTLPKVVSSSTEVDTDHDGLTDRLEALFGTNVGNPDSDGDGYMDGQEVFAGYSPTSTEPIILSKALRVHLKSQHLEQLVAGIPVSSFPISSGKSSMPTPVGTYRILNKKPRAWSSSAKLWMPYWMGFTTRGHGLHELPEWPNGYKEGVDHLGKPVSHGCVRMGIGTAKMIYDWTPVGTQVFIVKE